MSALSAAASDEDGDTIKQLREENEQLRQSLLNLHTVLEMTAKSGAHYARAAECLRETVIRWATRAEEAEEMLKAIGAGGVGKLEQPQSVTDCHQSQPQGEQEPVAYRHMHEDGWEYYDAPTGSDCDECQPLYTHLQPKRQPLTEADLYDIASNYFADEWAQRKAVMMLKDHGIGGEA